MKIEDIFSKTVLNEIVITAEPDYPLLRLKFSKKNSSEKHVINDLQDDLSSISNINERIRICHIILDSIWIPRQKKWDAWEKEIKKWMEHFNGEIESALSHPIMESYPKSPMIKNPDKTEIAYWKEQFSRNNVSTKQWAFTAGKADISEPITGRYSDVVCFESGYPRVRRLYYLIWDRYTNMANKYFGAIFSETLYQEKACSGAVSFLGRKLEEYKLMKGGKMTSNNTDTDFNDSIEKKRFSWSGFGGKSGLRELFYLLKRLKKLEFIHYKDSDSTILQRYFKSPDGKDEFRKKTIHTYNNSLQVHPEDVSGEISRLFISAIDKTKHQKFLQQCSNRGISIENGLEEALAAWIEMNQKLTHK